MPFDSFIILEKTLFVSFLLERHLYKVKRLIKWFKKNYTMVEIIGILGGMGPEATIYQYQLIVKNTPVNKDQDHIPTIIYSNSLIPDRTFSIMNDSHDEIIKHLSQSAKLLETAGVSFIIIPCNTAHYYIEPIRKSRSIPVLDMIEITAEKIINDISLAGIQKEQNKIGLLATTGVVKARIYHDRFHKKNLMISTPDESDQQTIMKIIYDIKLNGIKKEQKENCLEVMENIKKDDELSHIILGCTELPLLFSDQKRFKESLLVDPMEVIAKHVITKIKGKVRDI